jgi:general secretory pathway protein E
MSDALQLSFAFSRENGVLVHESQVVMRTGADLPTVLEMRRLCGPDFSPRWVSESEFNDLLEKVYQPQSGISRDVMDSLDEQVDLLALTETVDENADLLSGDDDAPVVRLINAILSEAIRDEASDIHIETFENNLVVRFRCDGQLRPVLSPSRKLAPLLISRIKVMSRLDIAEKRLPQDGRISLRIGQRSVDVRVSTIPSKHGERVVLRLLDKSAQKLELSSMGFSQQDYDAILGLMKKPHGIFLVTGPTGSGKSTTLYGMLGSINSKERNILTIEDPIEYELEGIGQTQVNARVDMTFSRGLRAILRQDPDVVMVGEIRDAETAQIAVQASLTGHLVLSTLHTNSAPGAITRLRDMGIEPFLLSSSLTGVLAQRLVRRLCPSCKVRKKATPQEQVWLDLLEGGVTHVWQGAGCDTCRGSGYKGRVAIHELMIVDAELQQAIYQGKHEDIFMRKTTSLRMRGLQCVSEGVTTLEEVLRVTSGREEESA